MDEKPFFEIDIRKFNDSQLSELKKFEKTYFDLDKILNTASDLKYIGYLKKYFTEQAEAPEDDFIKFLAAKVYNGRLTKNVTDQF
jgi:hypothetical protein